MERLDRNELAKCQVQVSEQLEKVVEALKPTSINPIPIGKETIGNYTKYIFRAKKGYNVDGGIKEVRSIKSYSISQAGELEEKSHIYKTLKSDKDSFGGIDKLFSALFVEALTESAERLKENAKIKGFSDEDIKGILQDSINLKEAAKSIENVATVIIDGKKYEQHEEWGEDASYYFASDKNQIDAEEFSRQLSLQLKILHNAGIVHYDLKLKNVLVKKENGQLKVRIIDFDFAYYIESPRYEFWL